MLPRWKKKTGKTKKPGDVPLRSIDPQVLIDAQSVKGAILAALAAMLILSLSWMFFTELTGRVFPWFSIIQGVFVGLAVRRFGRGLDWRFPLIAAVVAWAGSYFGNVLVAVPATTNELGASVFEVIRGLTWWSFRTFFTEVITVVDHIYAFCAAAVAVFYARRRLDRHEEFALRKRQES